jgi:large subunit ribosomal protein L4
LHLALSQGNASTLTRGEVRGGGRKPYKQKGSGNARRGSKRSPLMPGGGISFGPKVRQAFSRWAS